MNTARSDERMNFERSPGIVGGASLHLGKVGRNGTSRCFVGSYLNEKDVVMDNDTTKAPVQETANEARQGPPGRPVLKILIGGLLLAIVAWGAAELYGRTTDNTPKADNSTTASPSAPATNEPTVNTPAQTNPTPQTGSGGDQQPAKPNGTQ